MNLRRYLLGELPDEDQQRTERDFLENDAKFAEMLAAEDDLIDDFLGEKLTRSERNAFEHHFLATQRGRSKVALAAGLRSASVSVAEGAPSRGRAATILAIAASIILATTTAILLRQNRELEGERLALQNANAKINTELLKLRSTQPAAVFSFTVAGGLERGTASSAPLILPRSASSAELWLLLPHADYSSYRASLQTVEGRDLFVQERIRSAPFDRRHAAVFHVPAAHLQPGTYVIAVSGEAPDGTLQPVEDYSIRVVRPASS